jgi:hypothetical protein
MRADRRARSERLRVDVAETFFRARAERRVDAAVHDTNVGRRPLRISWVEPSSHAATRALRAEPLHRIEERSKVGESSANALPSRSDRAHSEQLSASILGGSGHDFVAPLVACLGAVTVVCG